MAVVNASTMPKDWAWFSEHAGNFRRRQYAQRFLRDRTDRLAGTLRRVDTPASDLYRTGSITYYHAETGVVAGIDCLISRTGYTGEDGFELYAAGGPGWDAMGRRTGSRASARDCFPRDWAPEIPCGWKRDIASMGMS